MNLDQRGRIEQIVLATFRRQQAVSDERLEEITQESQAVEANQTKLLDAHATYTDAPAKVRKQLNQAIFAGIFLGPEPDQIRTGLDEPFASITRPGDD